MIEKTFTIIDKDGIHARPAAILVSTVSKFKSEVIVEYKGKQVNLKSITSLMTLGAGEGDQIKVFVEGPDEEEAFQETEAVLKISSVVK
ncbi:HPr family phosphocarrier protein [Neobacillus vireti]|uniref:HPr family phosphocarrier protein n=1 Tax=Neobacillus vireti TaxID=220686 RepID=UPI002FFD7B05